MSQEISINYPESLAYSLKMNSNEFKKEIKTVSMIKLYEIGKISSSLASKILNIKRIDFLELLNKYNVSYFHKGMEDEIENDFANA